MSTCAFCNRKLMPGVTTCPGCGATVTQVSRTDIPLDDVRELVTAGRKIEAIKRLRELTGLGLAEAKQAVEAIADGGDPRDVLISRETTERVTVNADAEVIALTRDGQKIAAIKRYRELHGVGLKEAKQAVDAIEVSRGVAPARGGCLTFSALVIGIATFGTLTVAHLLA